ncbi:protein of unknown function [Acidithiobacillus ferrivorans]|uniref:Uncharacterized protein n=1 Tax=Acidithiobacillus ferrivorans TaxID=160808 RepID=A0A060UQ02_9PROT|nr:hypothetical protein AFERRI_400137 [Acidithiobacillus ferrivorans]SMH64383.1 protein of unknown function [Acidithiobacillus ferrivorans]
MDCRRGIYRSLPILTELLFLGLIVKDVMVGTPHPLTGGGAQGRREYLRRRRALCRADGYLGGKQNATLH